jgi:dTDP-4-dehydrorhamnose reductase
VKAKVLLLGGSGQVGAALVERLDQVTAPSRREFDLAEATPEAVRQLFESTRPDAIINCAAYTAVDRAEDEAEVANILNGSAVGTLAAIAGDSGIPFVTYSTDYVFDGRSNRPYVESSPTNPINAYGRSKLIGERLALEANSKTLVIRTSWVISATHRNFVATMLRLTGEGRSVRVVNDQHGSPTIAGDLAVATIEALDLGAGGVLHLTNQGATTWFDLANAAVREAALDPELLSPCTTAEYPTPALRPAYSVLGSERAAEIGVSPLPRWQDSLPALVVQLMTD